MGEVKDLAISPTRGFDWYRLLPKFWMQNEPTDRLWDAILNKALDEFGYNRRSDCTGTVGPFTVWVSNYPYSTGWAYEGIGPRKALPMCRTRIRLRRLHDGLSPDPVAEAGQALSTALARARGEAA